jgi:hypothetical protein
MLAIRHVEPVKNAMATTDLNIPYLSTRDELIERLSEEVSTLDITHGQKHQIIHSQLSILLGRMAKDHPHGFPADSPILRLGAHARNLHDAFKTDGISMGLITNVYARHPSVVASTTEYIIERANCVVGLMEKGYLLSARSTQRPRNRNEAAKELFSHSFLLSLLTAGRKRIYAVALCHELDTQNRLTTIIVLNKEKRTKLITENLARIPPEKWPKNLCRLAGFEPPEAPKRPMTPLLKAALERRRATQAMPDPANSAS